MPLQGCHNCLAGNRATGQEQLNAFVAEFKAELAGIRKHAGSHDRQMRKELDKIERSICRCVQFITEGDGNPDAVRDELRKLEQRKKDLKRSLANNRQDRDVEVHPNIPELYRRRVSELGTFLQDESARLQAVEVIRTLVDHIEVHKG